ncbi:hypothetical protein LP090_09615 [Moraxella bovis]|uniref:hypothetical protein n=1 Tax=Moraxella bovis TaxID=476 RepID=UPI002226E588|nr:hypothetical protein [Moraxella bovis]UYZ69713.1 hypothetical protein LP122_03365 [Moraxella bovis]UYZ72090.1 hypothetical protein LP089_03420 [Moraxella bovis]UYZ74455.1 hypothetical protein LP105_09240 [Moraxella bovis]UZA15399.1 hypothetical protein LP102_03360 [Moraxella bovis]UZA28735.1 hypothetical protein LP119_09480 [Moraxella bovis]
MASSEATLQARLAELKKAEQSFARLESLLKIDAISRQDYDDAQSAVEVARANVDVARAGVQNAKNDVATAQANIQSQRASINKAQNDLSTATQSDTMGQFLIEAVLVCILGGILGILMAFGIGGLIILN